MVARKTGAQLVILCIHDSPSDYPEQLQQGRMGYFFNRLALYLNRRRNPRTLEYMEKLCQEHFGDSSTLVASSEISEAQIGHADQVVLLWPDGNGYGWYTIENTVFRKMKPGTQLYVLNGRRRLFPYSKLTQLPYLLRRNAERLWLAEIVSTAVFILITPIFLLLDYLKGRS
jgi:hypothetical protein